jgi:hypothetical protein
MAAAHAAAAARIEAEHSAELNVADAQVDAALRLHALAAGRIAGDVNQMRDAIEQQIAASQQAAAGLREQIAALEAPITQHTSQNQDQNQQIEQMRIQVGELLKQAQDKGYADGLDSYLEAMQLRREADKIEYEVSQREIDLDHELSPQHRMAQAQLAQVEGMIQALEAARAQIDAFATAATDDSKATRAKIEQLSSQINGTLGQIKTQADGGLAAAYESAVTALDRASTSAAKAASGGGPAANTGKMLGASVQESAARTHLAAARGLADRLAVLQKIKNSGGALPASSVDAQVTELQAAITRHRDAAKAALESASQALEGVSGGSGEVEAFRVNLASMTNTLSGKAPQPDSEPETDESAGGDSAAAPAAPRIKGADSPEALLASVKSIKGISDVDRVFDLILPPTDPAAKQMMTMARGLIGDVKKLDAALQGKFAQGLESFGGEMQMPTTANLGLDTATIENVTDTTASLSVTANGKTQSIPLAKVDDRWYIGDPNDPNGLGALSAMGPGGTGAGGAPDGAAATDPEMQKAMMQMVGAMMGGFRKAVQGMTRRVSAGEFATFEDFKAAAEKVAQEAIGGAMGGMPGMGGGTPAKRPPAGTTPGNPGGIGG